MTDDDVSSWRQRRQSYRLWNRIGSPEVLQLMNKRHQHIDRILYEAARNARDGRHPRDVQPDLRLSGRERNIIARKLSV